MSMITPILSRRLAPLTLAVALAAAAAACGGRTAGRTIARGADSAGFPVTVKAANGPVQIGKRPTAIISLSSTATEMLYAIGAGRQVKAVDSQSNYPRQAPHTTLAAITPNVEAILAYHPDLVIVYYNTGNVIKRLTSLGVPVLYEPAPANLAGVWAQYDQLGAATGHLAQARHQVARLRRQVGQIIAAVPHRARPLTYYYELQPAPYYSVTSSTFIGGLLGMLGLKNIADAAKGAAASGGYPQLSTEYILKANPDLVILADTICCHQSAASVAKRPGWTELTAVRDRRVIALNDDIASRWGPRLVILLRDVLAGIQASR
jgi:iron complex transport system substrate-binding protein